MRQSIQNMLPLCIYIYLAANSNRECRSDSALSMVPAEDNDSTYSNSSSKNKRAANFNYSNTCNLQLDMRLEGNNIVPRKNFRHIDSSESMTGFPSSAKRLKTSTSDSRLIETSELLSSGSKKSELKKVRSKCDICKAKVGLLGFACRCGGQYCGTHRYSNIHGCKFDYKKLGKEEITKANPVVKASKITKI
ncbi:uncharacterized protein LOC135926695 [Gordionus sp. m RMFG-2023]|uniref:uncharacterized protein LOC135926695 n=1 Tax=Gordionus sp. m RMFG-2023 TaxID=3053472 RepID=UPI0031FBED0C